MPRSTRLLAVFAAAVLTAGLAACSSSTSTGSSSTGSLPTSLIAGDSSSVASGAESSSAESSSAEWTPVNIQHAFGTTTISEKPVRVATVQWANQEVPLALGIVPVGMAKANFGDDDTDGMLPWVKERLDELGGPAPVLFDETDGIDFEAVGDSNPDVILAAYSGLTQEDYDTL